jgi:hypothetical protein
MNIFKKNKNTLKFGKVYEDFLDVVPMKKMIPQWYKNVPSKIYDTDIWNANTAKACMPFLDTFMTGYAIVSPVDIMVGKHNEDIDNNESPLLFSWSNNQILVVKTRDNKPMPTLPIPQEYNQNHYVWIMPCSLEAPKGYSLLITHPLNRFDLPFTTLTGIIDDFKMPAGQTPVLFKNNFSGIIPAGTPIAQIIPFKREDWIIKEDKNLYFDADTIGKKARNVMSGFYKNNFWNKKNYN